MVWLLVLIILNVCANSRRKDNVRSEGVEFCRGVEFGIGNWFWFKLSCETRIVYIKNEYM